jgi:hypothetical protein
MRLPSPGMNVTVSSIAIDRSYESENGSRNPFDFSAGRLPFPKGFLAKKICFPMKSARVWNAEIYPEKDHFKKQEFDI